MSEEPLQRIHVGLGGWDLPPLEGIFYPAKPGRGFRKLAWYSRFFDFVELNASFYNSDLSPALAKRWVQDVAINPRFQFSVKLFRGFTHTMDATAKDLISVQRLLRVLRDAQLLVGVVAQFPSAFEMTKERLAYLQKLADAFHEDQMFIELRHRTWNADAARESAHTHRFCMVNTDLPALAKHVPLRSDAFNGHAYFRMMGRNAEAWDHPERGDRYAYRYTENELKDLMRRLREVYPVAAKTFVVFHNDANVDSPVNGFQLRKMLQPRTPLIAPAGLVRRFPELRGVADSEDETSELGFTPPSQESKDEPG